MSGKSLTIVETDEAERVPPGYKQTDVGVIPENWEVLSLSELLDFRNGVNADKDAYGEGTPFINVLEVITNTHLTEKDIPGLVSLPASLVEIFAVYRGDVLFNRTSETQEEVGLSAVYIGDEKVVFGGFVIRGRKRGTTLDDTYAGYAFRSPNVRSQIIAKGQGAVRANIGQQELSKVVAAVPPLPEQRAIATALSDVDDLISSLDRLISKKRAVKTAAMQQLLTGKRRLPGFEGTKAYKQTAVGDIPEDWDVQPLSECLIASPEYGINAPAVPYDSQLPTYIRITDITEEGKFSVENRVSVSNAKATKYTLAHGDLVFARTGASVGKSYLHAEEDFAPVFAGFLIRVKPDKNKLDPVFIANYVTTSRYWSWIKMMSARSGQPGVNGEQYAQLPIPVPPLPEQQAIATILSDMDAEIEALEARREKTRQVKQGMMQELLTGCTRLVGGTSA